MTDLARYFEHYRRSGKSGVTRVTDVTGRSTHCNTMPFVPDGLSPGDDISRVTGVTNSPDAMPSQDNGVVTPVTSVAWAPGDHAGQQEIVLRQQVTQSVTRVTCVTREIDRGRPETTDPTCCAWCGEGERSGAMIVPFGTATAGHVWLHSGCWREWFGKLGREAMPANAETD